MIIYWQVLPASVRSPIVLRLVNFSPLNIKSCHRTCSIAPYSLLLANETNEVSLPFFVFSDDFLNMTTHSSFFSFPVSWIPVSTWALENRKDLVQCHEHQPLKHQGHLVFQEALYHVPFIRATCKSRCLEPDFVRIMREHVR